MSRWRMSPSTFPLMGKPSLRFEQFANLAVRACQGGRARGKIAKAKGGGKVAGEVVGEAEVMFRVVEGCGLAKSWQFPGCTMPVSKISDGANTP